MPNDIWLSEVQALIDNFVTGNFKISKIYLTVSVEKGGIGLFNVKEFISGLQCSWIKRAHNSGIDTWSKKLNEITGNNVVNVTPSQLCNRNEPALAGICTSFFEFKRLFYRKNFMKSFVFGNPILIKSRRARCKRAKRRH
jgi:hypothetical protein